MKHKFKVNDRVRLLQPVLTLQRKFAIGHEFRVLQIRSDGEYKLIDDEGHQLHDAYPYISLEVIS